MELLSSALYQCIKDSDVDISEIPVRDYKKGQMISRMDSDNNSIIYILTGKVKVLSTSYLGKAVLVDELDPDEFSGHISKVRGQNFNCDIVAKTNCKVAELTDEVFNRLMKQDAFALYFYKKTSSRVYHMYKKMLVRHLYSLDEIVAYYIWYKSTGDIFVCQSMYCACDSLNISRRGLYNSINKLIDHAVLEKAEDYYVIKDWKYLMELGKNVSDFFANDQIQGV